MNDEVIPKLGLGHSELLDVHRWSDYPEVNEFINKIYASLDFSEVGKEKTAKHNLKVVLLDLYVRWIKDPDLVTAFSRTHSDYKAKSRYNALKISKKVIPVVDILIAAGLLHERLGWKDTRKGGQSFRTRIWPSNELRAIFHGCGIDPKKITHHPDRETVLLKDDQKKLIEYEDTSFTIKLRGFLKKFNELLLNTEIHHPAHYERSSFTYCVFSKGSWDYHGRFYNAWQNIPSKDRPGILLNGQPTVEIDFSAMHPYLIYAEAGLNLNALDDSGLLVDPYEHEDFSRDQMKSMFLVMINARSETMALRGYVDPATNKNHLPVAETRPILEAIKKKHFQIAHAFCSNKGIKLMRKDAMIAEFIMRSFLHAGKPILPIHDSFVVEASEAQRLLRAMFESLRFILRPGVINKSASGLPFVKVIMTDNARHFLPEELSIRFANEKEEEFVALLGIERTGVWVNLRR